MSMDPLASMLKPMILIGIIGVLGCSGGGGGTNAPPSPQSQIENSAAEGPANTDTGAALRFVRLSSEVGLDYIHGFTEENSSTEAVAGVSVADFDNDGWLDLYIAQGDTGPNLLYRNISQNGEYQFENVAAIAGVTIDIDHKSSGPVFADFDGDGDDDLFVGSIEYDGLKVFSNNGDGTFDDITSSTGLAAITRENNVSLTFGDYNQDGFLDLFIGHWTFTDNELPLENAQLLRRNNGDGTFTEVSESLGISDPRQGRGVVCFDGDRDGDIDIFTANNGDGPSLFRNDGGNQLNWLNVKLIGAAPNTNGYGARIYVTIDDTTQMREVMNGNNYVS